VIGCKVGDTITNTSQGYWQMVSSGVGLGKCIIPGAPHPDSPSGIPGITYGQFRIEGKYMIITSIQPIWQNEYTPPSECPPACITSGYKKQGCPPDSLYRTYYLENNMCVDKYDDGTISYTRYSCFVDHIYVTLFEWVCNSNELPCTECNQGGSCGVNQDFLSSFY